MYVKPLPTGTTPTLDQDRLPILRVTNGDALVLTTYVERYDTVPATKLNSRLKFALAETRFNYIPLWTGDWNSGIVEINRDQHPGLVKIAVPKSVADTLRRGVYAFSLTVADTLNQNTRTALAGHILVEYEPTSPNHNIPYKNQDTGE